MERLQPIQWLSRELGQEVPSNIIEHEYQAKEWHTQLGVWPTIGCEVEVNWSTLFPDLAREYFGAKDEFDRFRVRYEDLSVAAQGELDAQCAELDAIYKPKYEATTVAGIPNGNDGYWEFANAPTYHWQTLGLEVKLLTEAGLIPEGDNHSFHITLGGVDTDGGGPCFILSGLELTEVTPERIIDATIPNRYGGKRGWARRGEDGVRRREAGMLAMNQTVGCEFRTLTVNSARQAERLLQTAQVLGAVLLAYRSRKDSRSEVVQNLAPLWGEYRQELKNLWIENNLPIESWGSPIKNTEVWQRWAESLRSRNIPGTYEYDTVLNIGNITQTALQIMLSDTAH